MFADVFIPYPLEETFTYRVPEGMTIEPFCRVKVDFAGRRVIAVVHRLHCNEPSGITVKDIDELIDPAPIFDHRLFSIIRYMAETYLSSIGEALSMALPSGLSASSKRPAFPAARDRYSVLLNGEQRAIRDDILASRGKGLLAHLIFGVTGSGKTEVYLEIARTLIAEGLSVIYLVPEISLSSVVFSRLRAFFGDHLAVYHSSLTPNQRLDTWIRFYRGEAKVVVGTRSAVFLPCPRLGMIVIDEEHDASYKEHRTPRYNARRIALRRSKEEGALVVMGSATPAMESMYACERGMMKLHRLTARWGGASLPSVKIVKIDSARPRSILSTPLKLATRRAIESGHQVIFLLNRRGFAPIVICPSCGWTVECPDCSIGMNYHRDSGMVCHYCGRRGQIPPRCAGCGAEDLKRLGSGTQRIEEIVENEFKGLRIVRLDSDTSRKRITMPDLMKGMKDGSVDLMVGTQLVAKGFDFPNVTVVGVLLADLGLHMPDFRATERIFSLLMQAAGRSGRGKEAGMVIVQTINDDNPMFGFLQRMDYEGFCRAELEARRALSYPPFARLARLLVRGKNEGKVADSIQALADALKRASSEIGSAVAILGPSAAPIARIGGNYRYHIILKSHDAASIRKIILNARGAVSGRDVYLEIDIDPYELL